VSPAVEAAGVEIAVLAFGESVEGVLDGGLWTPPSPPPPPHPLPLPLPPPLSLPPSLPLSGLL